MDYVLDTNILLTYLRKNKYSKYIDKTYAPLSIESTPILSVVSIGEIQSIAIQNKWGIKKLESLQTLLNKFVIANINVESIITRYAEIDAFSQGKLEGDPQPRSPIFPFSTMETKPLNTSSRNMVKNDLWIAATAFILKVKLLTTDNDFKHLDNQFIELEMVNFK